MFKKYNGKDSMFWIKEFKNAYFCRNNNCK